MITWAHYLGTFRDEFCFSLPRSAGLEGVQIDAALVRGPPEARDESVFEAASLSVDRYRVADLFFPIGAGERGALRALIGVHDHARDEAAGCRVQSLDFGRRSISLQSVVRKDVSPGMFEMRRGGTLHVNDPIAPEVIPCMTLPGSGSRPNAGPIGAFVAGAIYSQERFPDGRQLSDVDTLDLTGPIHPQRAATAGVGLVGAPSRIC